MLQDLSPGSVRIIPASTDVLPAQGRLPGRRPVGVIDIGSNSVRLVIYEGNARALTTFFNEKVLSGLGKGLAQTGRLNDAAMASALSALSRFRSLAAQAGVTELHPIATAAAREAANGPDFVASAEAALGQPIRILSGADEARFAAEGVLAGFHEPDGIAGDLGGGSLELVDIHGGGFEGGLTMPLGGLRLQDLSGGDLGRARQIADAHVSACGLVRRGEGRPFYAIGGTWRNLAKLHMEQRRYPLHVMHGYEMAPDAADAFLSVVARGDVDRLPGIAAVSKSRRALLAFGAVALHAVLRHLKPSAIVVSALGVREGYLFSQLSPAERARDPLIEAAVEMAILRSRSPAHAMELVGFSSRTFDALGIDETSEQERLRIAACLLADVGWRAHPDYRGNQALSTIAHAAFPALDHRGRAFLGLASYYRHEGSFDQTHVPAIETLLDERLLSRARLLASLFRVSYLLTGAMPGLLDRLRWIADPRGGFTLAVPREAAGLLGEKPEGRLQAFARLLNKTLRMEAR